MKTFSKFLSVLLVLAIVVGIMPLSAIHAHAEDFSWNDNAVMTLKCGDYVIEPTSVIQTADTKMKIYSVESINDYTLTTSDDNDYAVMFEVYLTEIKDEYGYTDYDYEMTITLDNVTIRTRNPRANQDTGIHAAMMFSDKKAANRYETLNIELIGNNTVELLGVENDSADDVWSSVAFVGPNTVIKGDGTLNATCRYNNAVGAASAVYTENTIGLYDTVTLNATADVEAKEADVILGDGLYFHNMNFITEADTTVNINASACGINHNTATVYATYLDNLEIYGDLHIRAADYGINWPAGRMYVGDNANLSIAGLTEGSASNVGILIRRDVQIGENCNVTVDALGAAYSCQVTTTANPSAPLTIGKNSVVKMSGSVTSSDFVIDCGIKLSGKNNIVSGTGEEWYGESWGVSELVLEENAKLTINGGYRALQAAAIELYDGSDLTITTTDVVDSDDLYQYGPVYLATGTSYIYSGSTFVVETPAADAVYGYTKLNLESDDVYIKAAETAMDKTVTRGTGITTFESDDGINWIPFANSSNKPYFTTREPATHICAASRTANTYSDKVWTPIEGEDKHTAKCIYCAADIIADCQWDRGAWSYNSGNYTLKFECEICEKERISDVEYHSHTYETWTPLLGGNNLEHESTCTYPGCGASTTGYCSNYFGEEYHINPTTLRKDCTRCGQYSTREIEAGTSTHFSAKNSTCCAPGNIEYYNCGHCNQYYADEKFTTKLSPTDVFITPVAHKYGADGICTVCSNKEQTLSFVELDDGLYDYNEYNCIIVGKTADGTMYVLGNTTIDGKREAVMIPSAQIDENGIITMSSSDAEFLMWDNMNNAFVVDGGYFSLLDGKIYVYDTARKDDANISMPAEYMQEEYYDESGLGYMQAYISGKYSEREYLTFNADTLKFEVSDTRISSLYIYVQQCEHARMSHNKPVSATCTEQGTIEYWYCGKCQTYYSNAQGTALLEIPEDIYNIEEYLTQPATGHDYNDKGVCKNCSMKRPVYKQVSSLEDFDKLSESASYIIVIKDGDKTYAAHLPSFKNPCTTDSDGNGIVDAIDIDENKNTIPDSFEALYNYYDMGDWNGDEIVDENDYKEWIGDLTEDGIVDFDDYVLFLEYNHWDIENCYEELAMRADNFVEVTMAEDGSITVTNEGAMEFQMMTAGVWGGQSPLEQDYQYDLEYYGILNTERIRAAWVPNFWIANSGHLGYYNEGHFMTQNRLYGDSLYPGIIDNKNWKISFNPDGTACLVSTWSSFDDTAALQFVKYTDYEGLENMTIVGLYGDQWEYSDIMVNKTATLPVYLFASEAEFDHTHTWGEWSADDTTDTHTRKCTFDGCPAKQTESHVWNDGVITAEPTCITEGIKTFTCSICDATKTENIDALDHDWSDWSYDNVDSHVRYCLRNCGTEEFGGHEWGDKVKVDDTSHKMVCTICKGEHTEDHIFGNFTDDANATTHTKSCDCGASITLEHRFDEGNIINWPTHLSEGAKEYSCLDCLFTKTESIPATPEHEFGDWVKDALTDNAHYRECICGEKETATCKYGEGKIINGPSEFSENNVMLYVCDGCGRQMIIENTTTTDEIANEEEKVTITIPDESSALISADTILQVEQAENTTDDTVKENIETTVGENAESIVTFDISMLINGVEVQPGGDVQVNVPLPDDMNINDYSDITVVYIDDNGNVTPCDTVVNDDGTVTFTTDHFSTYAIVGVLNSNYGDTNDDGNIDNKDYALLMQYLNGWDVTININSADTNADGNIDNKDYALLMQYLNGWDVTLGKSK